VQPSGASCNDKITQAAHIDRHIARGGGAHGENVPAHECTLMEGTWKGWQTGPE
jgi:hypothetical protein